MRRVSMRKTPVKLSTRRVRDEVEDRIKDRPEIRRDIRRTWWPEG